MQLSRRISGPVVILALVLLLMGFGTVMLARRAPRIELIDPAVARTGEVVSIMGSHFGLSGRIEIDGRPLSTADIHRWSPNLIAFRVGSAVRTGVVQVHTGAGSSNGIFFSNGDSLPAIVNGTTGPVIRAVRPAGQMVGRLLTIEGRGFGPPVATSRLYLAEHTLTPLSPWVQRWTDDRIELIVPPIAAPETVLDLAVDVEGFATASADSTLVSAGAPLSDQAHSRRYAIRQQVAVGNADDETIVWVPRPPQSTGQPVIQELRSARTPVVEHTERVIRYRLFVGGDDGRAVVDRTDLVTVVPVRLRVDNSLFPPATVYADPAFLSAFAHYLRREEQVPVLQKEIMPLVATARNGSPSVFVLAERVYAAVVARLAPDPSGPADAVEAMTARRASAVGYVNLFVAAARSVGIPARRYAGLLLLDTGEWVAHRWAEVFVPAYGWLTVDPALGDGLFAESLLSLNDFYGDNRRTAAFGNLDANRIALDRDGPLPLREGSHFVAARESYALGAQGVEVRSDEQSISIGWEAPTIIGQY